MPGISAMYSSSSAKSAVSPSSHRAAVGVDVLPQQRDLLHAVIGEIGHFGQHIVERARDFFTARVRHDTETAVLAAAFHDRDKGTGACHSRCRQVIELLDLGKRDVDLRTSGAPACIDQLRQPMQRLRTEHHVDIGCARHDGRAFLADTAADADQQVTASSASGASRARGPEHLFLGFFPHRARVEQDDVRVLDRAGGRQPFRRRGARRPFCPSRSRSGSGIRTCGCRACGMSWSRGRCRAGGEENSGF